MMLSLDLIERVAETAQEVVVGLDDRAIEEEMFKRLGAGRVIKIEEPLYGGANGALKIAHDMPEEYWEKLK